MAFKRYIMPVTGHAGVFVCGGLSWWMVSLGHYATAMVCALGALMVTHLLMRKRRMAFAALPSIPPPQSIFAAEQSRKRLNALVDETPSPLLLQEEDGRLIAVNRAARQLFGSSSQLPAVVRNAFLGPGDRLADLKDQIDWGGHRYALHKAALDDARLAILIDITPEVRAAEANALRDMLKVLNHELMNALTPVASMSLSALDLIRDDTPASRDAARKALERVVARTDGLIGFVDSYRALTRLPPPDIKPEPLKAFIDDASQAFRARWTDQEVSFEVDSHMHGANLGEERVMMDAEQVRLCLTNLLNNAAEAALEARAPCVRLSLDIRGGHVEIGVQDNGAGVDPALAETIFLPFYTTKTNGTGVGLSLARQILHGHGSTLRLKASAEPYGGAHFSFELARFADKSQAH